MQKIIYDFLLLSFLVTPFSGFASSPKDQLHFLSSSSSSSGKSINSCDSIEDEEIKLTSKITAKMYEFLDRLPSQKPIDFKAELAPECYLFITLENKGRLAFAISLALEGASAITSLAFLTAPEVTEHPHFKYFAARLSSLSILDSSIKIFTSDQVARQVFPVLKTIKILSAAPRIRRFPPASPHHSVEFRKNQTQSLLPSIKKSAQVEDVDWDHDEDPEELDETQLDDNDLIFIFQNTTISAKKAKQTADLNPKRYF